MSPERQALAAAIEAFGARHEEAARTQAAIDKADEAWRDARRARDAAEAAVETAKTDAADYLTASALGTAGAAPISIKRARALLAEAEDDVEVAKAALDALKARHDGLTEAAGYLQRRVTEAQRAALRASPEVAALLEEVQRLQSELVNKGSALLCLVDAQVLATNIGDPAFAAFWRLKSPMASWEALRTAPGINGAPAWKAALAALMVDATAPLPPLRQVETVHAERA